MHDGGDERSSIVLAAVEQGEERHIGCFDIAGGLDWSLNGGEQMGCSTNLISSRPHCSL